MKFGKYLKDKGYFILIYVIASLIVFSMLLAFKIELSLIIAVIIILLCAFILIILFDYFRKKSFYQRLFNNISKLDKAFLVLEMINEPDFYEGHLLYDALEDINKSMCENVNSYKNSINDFKEYIEMWIHEVKLPISSMVLMMHNHKSSLDKKLLEQINRIEVLVEQVLYYVRSENAEKDYLIKEVSLLKVIHDVALKNKDNFLENNIDFEVNAKDIQVYTDSKWLGFIINQIINNSIKYKKENNSFIKIDVIEENDKAIISIMDNGIGIPSTDISRVFDKTYTGENGRTHNKSTGMGLFIVKNLCNKLGHKIEIESIKDEYTKVNIIISKNEFYNVVK